MGLTTDLNTNSQTSSLNHQISLFWRIFIKAIVWSVISDRALSEGATRELTPGLIVFPGLRQRQSARRRGPTWPVWPALTRTQVGHTALILIMHYTYWTGVKILTFQLCSDCWLRTATITTGGWVEVTPVQRWGSQHLSLSGQLCNTHL